MHVWNLWGSVPPTRLRTTVLEELEIPSEWTVTGGETPESFLIHIKSRRGSIYIILAIKNSIQHLVKSNQCLLMAHL